MRASYGLRGLLQGLWLTAVSGCLAASVSASIRFETPLVKQDNHYEISGITAIVQDQHGFIWLGGENGLGRYDGQSLKLYQSSQNAPSSLPSSYIWDLALDRDEVLWIASSGSLSRYDSKTDGFQSFSSIGGRQFVGDTLSTLAVDAANNLYVGATKGLHRVEPTRKRMDIFVPDPPIKRSNSSEQLRDIEITPDGRVWVATAGMGVAVFDPRSETFDYLLHNPDDPNSLTHNNVKTIEADNAGRIWIGTYGGGISVYHPDTGNFLNYLHDPDNPGSLGSSVVWYIYQDSYGSIWVSLEQGGLARFDEASGTFEHFRHDTHNPATVVSNQLRAIYEDNNRDLWIGAFPSGVSYYNRSKQLFRTYHAKAGDPSGLSNNAVTSLFEDSMGTIWIGTEGGLNAFDSSSGTFKHYQANPQDPQALMVNPILAIEEDSWGSLWVGTWAGGLHRFDRETEVFTRYFPDDTDPTSITCKFIWDIAEDKGKRLWIATESGGLNLYHRDTDSFTSYRNRPEDPLSIAGDFIWSLMAGGQGQLWIGTFKGVDRFDPDNEHFYHFPHSSKDGKSVSSEHIRSFYEDSRGLVWIGTRDHGVSIYDAKGQSFRYIDNQQGLMASTVSSILEDDHGNMWLATTNGLAHVEYPSLRVTTYGKEHGLAGNNYNRNASLKDSKGNLYFGSTEGLTVFNPDNLATPATDFPIYLTGFRILNQNVIVAKGSPLESSIIEATEITLDHKDIMFSFDFAALNYRNPSANRYAYKLEGFDRDWNYINTKTTATYTNIDPGTYTFRVRAINGNGKWNDGPALKLVIEPPPWRAWWAYLGYAGVAGMGLYFSFAYLRLRLSAQSYKTQSITDPLTGLYNRAGISQITNGLFSSSETRRDTAVMLMDIDHFKRINDRSGHDAGDRILTGIADLVLRNVRRGDYLGRWGGEEFILLCPSTTATSAQAIAEKVRCAVANHVFEAGAFSTRVSISIGVAITGPDESFVAVLKRADVALYKAKSLSRNCVCFSDSDAPRKH